MGFWVEATNHSNNQESSQEFARFDIELLAAGKRTGLSFAEMNELTAQDLLDYIKAYTGTNEKEDKPRMATQEDIDAFYSAL